MARIPERPSPHAWWHNGRWYPYCPWPGFRPEYDGCGLAIGFEAIATGSHFAKRGWCRRWGCGGCHRHHAEEKLRNARHHCGEPMYFVASSLGRKRMADRVRRHGGGFVSIKTLESGDARRYFTDIEVPGATQLSRDNALGLLERFLQSATRVQWSESWFEVDEDEGDGDREPENFLWAITRGEWRLRSIFDATSAEAEQTYGRRAEWAKPLPPEIPRGKWKEIRDKKKAAELE